MKTSRWGLRPKHGPAYTHPTVSPTLVHHIQRGRVHIAPNVREVGGDSVQFEDGSTAHDVDVIIKCTVYTIDLPYLEKPVRDVILDEQTNELKMYHTVFSPQFGSSLAMIGYVQPIGSLISISEIQAQWLGMLIAGICSLPDMNEMKERIVKDKMRESYYKDSTRHTLQREVIPYCDEIAILVLSLRSWIIPSWSTSCCCQAVELPNGRCKVRSLTRKLSML